MMVILVSGKLVFKHGIIISFDRWAVVVASNKMLFDHIPFYSTEICYNGICMHLSFFFLLNSCCQRSAISCKRISCESRNYLAVHCAIQLIIVQKYSKTTPTEQRVIHSSLEVMHKPFAFPTSWKKQTHFVQKLYSKKKYNFANSDICCYWRNVPSEWLCLIIINWAIIHNYLLWTFSALYVWV